MLKFNKCYFVGFILQIKSIVSHIEFNVLDNFELY
jgi:hypothetical protein